MKENFPFNTPLEEVREGKARFSKYSSHFSFMTPSMPIPMVSAPTHSHSVYIYAHFNEEQQTTNVKFHGISFALA